jgi:hypothetical protein
MDHTYDQDHVNFNMASGFDQQYAPVDPYHQRIFAPATPRYTYENPGQHHHFHDHGPNGYDTFMSDVIPHGAYNEPYQRPMTPERTPQPTEPNDTQFYGAVEGSNEHTADVQEEEMKYAPDFWRTLVDFEIPDFTQTSVKNIPGLQALYVSYLNGYGPRSTTTNTTRMQYAKAFAFALITHYYPTSQHYSVAPASPGPIAKNGMSFILAADDQSDILKDMPKKKPKAFRRKVPTKKELERAKKEEKAAKVAEFAHGWKYMNNLEWDHIAAEDVAAFVVLRKTTVTDVKTGVVTDEQYPHTYFAIMVDNFEELPQLSTANTVHRSDILTDALCRGGKIQNGHGILLYGPRLEFYSFDRGSEWVYFDEHEEEGEQEAQDIEPKMEVLSSGGQGLEMDLRTMSLDVVDAAFRDVAAREVVYAPEPEAMVDEGAGSAQGAEHMEEY